MNSVPAPVTSTVDRELIERFGRNGFVVVPGVFTDAELDHFGPAVDAAVADDMAHDDRALAEKSR